MVSFKDMSLEKTKVNSIQDFDEKIKAFGDKKIKAAIYMVREDEDEGLTNYCLFFETNNVLYDRRFPTEKGATWDDFMPNLKRERELYIMLFNDLVKNYREIGYEVERVPVIEVRDNLPEEMSDKDLAYFFKIAHIKGVLS